MLEKNCQEMAHDYVELLMFEDAFKCLKQVVETNIEDSQNFISLINISILMKSFESSIELINMTWFKLSDKVKMDIIENIQEMKELGDLEERQLSAKTLIFLKSEIYV